MQFIVPEGYSGENKLNWKVEDYMLKEKKFYSTSFIQTSYYSTYFQSFQRGSIEIFLNNLPTFIRR